VVVVGVNVMVVGLSAGLSAAPLEPPEPLEPDDWLLVLLWLD